MTVFSQATGRNHEMEAGILKPLLSGDEIRAFSLKHYGQWILFPYDISGTRPVFFSEKRMKADFPRGWEYLKTCEKRLRARERGKMDGPGWWAYGRNQNLDQFEQPKVMVPGYNDKPSAGLDLDGSHYHVSGYSLTVRENSPLALAALVCLMNSNLLFWLLKKRGVALQRGFVEFRPQYLEKLPIAPLGSDEKAALEAVATRAARDGYDTIKAELNQIVYRLYGLTDVEIAIVEGK